jgi:hypothetical protein
MSNYSHARVRKIQIDITIFGCNVTRARKTTIETAVPHVAIPSQHREKDNACHELDANKIVHHMVISLPSPIITHGLFSFTGGFPACRPTIL